MYEAHFGLASRPFALQPDPAYIFWSQQHRLAAKLLAGRGEGAAGDILMMSGQVGAGKTTLIMNFVQQPPPGTTVALVRNIPPHVTDVLPWVMNALGLPSSGTGAERESIVRDWLQGQHEAGRQVVLIVDEAQNLHLQAFAGLNDLMTVNDAGDRLIFLVLVGQPELQSIMRQPENAAIAARIGSRIQLGRMRPEETRAYVGHRMQQAGAQDAVFSDSALDLIHNAANGVPRMVNLIADHLLVGAFAEGRDRIDASTAAEIIAESEAPALSAIPIGVILNQVAREPAAKASAPDRADDAADAAQAVPRAAPPMAGKRDQPAGLPEAPAPDDAETPNPAQSADPAPSAADRGADPSSPAALRDPAPGVTGADQDVAGPARAATPAPAPGAIPAASGQRPDRHEQGPVARGPVGRIGGGTASARPARGGAPWRWLGNPIVLAAITLVMVGASLHIFGRPTDPPAGQVAAVNAERGLVPKAAPAAVEPTAAQPTAAQPTAAQPKVAQPRVAQPRVAQPTAAERAAAEPAPAERRAAEPAAPGPSSAPQPDAAKAATRQLARETRPQLRAALDLAATDPEAAAIVLARAAVAGSDRAAYYLGQLHETGDGVPLDPLLAKAWYRRAARSLPDAQERLAEMTGAQLARPSIPPEPLLSVLRGGRLDLVWKGSGSARSYRVEIGDTNGRVLAGRNVPIPAMSFKLPQEAAVWRVTALNRQGGDNRTGWIPIPAE